MLHFGIIKVSLVSQTEHQEALSFVYSSQKKCMWIAIIFVTNDNLCGVNF